MPLYVFFFCVLSLQWLRSRSQSLLCVCLMFKSSVFDLVFRLHKRFSTLDDDMMDSPKAPMHLGTFAAIGLNAKELAALLNDKDAMGKMTMARAQVAVSVLAAVKAKDGEDAARDLLKAIGGDLTAFQLRPNPSTVERLLSRNVRLLSIVLIMWSFFFSWVG